MINRSSYILALLFLFTWLSISQAQPTTKGTELWVGYMENLDLSSNGPPVFALYISSEFNTTGVVSFPSTGLNIGYTVTANQVTEIVIPPATLYSNGSNVIGDKGIKITANDAVSVSAMHYRSFFSDASVALPITELGLDYILMAGEDYTGNSPSEFVVVSTTDSNTVEITPSVVTLGLNPPGIPFNITLDEGETYQIQANGDLTGSSIKSLSSIKIAVFSGARQASIDCPSADNHIYDVNFPIEAWGLEYVIVPFKDQGGDRIKILASEDNTKIFRDCSIDTLLNKGDYYDVLVSAPTSINANKPIAIAQYNQSQECNASNSGDPSMLVLPPISARANDISFKVLDVTNGNGMGQYYDRQYVNVITKTNSIDKITLDGLSIDTAFSPVLSKPIYSYAQIVLDSGSGDRRLYSDSSFYAYAYGFGYFDAYTYFLGYDEKVMAVGTVNLGKDTTVCPGVFVLDATTPNAAYLWQDNSTNSIYTVNQQGTYWVNVILGCDTVTDTVNVYMLSTPTASAGPDTTICLGDSIQLNGSGGNTFSWSPQSSLSNPTISSPWASPQQGGSYFLEVTDSNGCTDMDDVLIDIHSASKINQNDTTICLGDSIQLYATGGGSFLWTPAIGLSNDTVSNPIAFPTDTTLFIVNIIDTNGCAASDSIELYPALKPSLTITGQSSICLGDSVMLTAAGGVTYAWSTGESSPSITVNPVSNIWYTVIATNLDCPKPSMDSILIQTYPLPIADAGLDATVLLGGSTTLSGIGGIDYTWSPSIGLSCTSCQYPEASPLETSIYSLTVTDSNGCVGFGSITIYVDASTEVFVPNLFSPNGDGTNDIFHIDGKGIQEFELTVYNRWGQQVFSSTSSEEGWNGSFQGQEVNPGVFVYILKGVFINGEKFDERGKLTLIR